MNIHADFTFDEAPAPAAKKRRPRLKRTPTRRIGLRRLLRGGSVDDAGRLPRYALTFLLVLAVIWGPVAAYLAFAPLGFISTTVLILPGSGSSASVNLTEIGQASSSSASPFARSAVSPTDTYKALLGSDRVRGAAATALDVEARDFPEPRVKLVDQTSLIRVEARGGDPDRARAGAEALLTAFMAELDQLRADEVARRERSFQTALADYRESVAGTRAAITRLKEESGLLSTEQYDRLVGETDALEVRVRDLAATLALKNSALEALTLALEVTPETAAAILRLHADPEFQALAEAMSAHGAELAAARATYGPKHPTRRAAENAYFGARARANARASTLTGMDEAALAATVDLAPSGERSGLLARLVTLTAERDGLRAEHALLSTKLAADRDRVRALVAPASALDDLGRDYQVAEAVFTSALARNDTTKTDVYASYPLVQVLEPPSRPTEPSSPRRLLALAAGVAATVFALVGLLLGWIRRPLIDRLLTAPEGRV